MTRRGENRSGLGMINIFKFTIPKFIVSILVVVVFLLLTIYFDMHKKSGGKLLLIPDVLFLIFAMALLFVLLLAIDAIISKLHGKFKIIVFLVLIILVVYGFIILFNNFIFTDCRSCPQNYVIPCPEGTEFSGELYHLHWYCTWKCVMPKCVPIESNSG
ncbi:MAG: hypothetical protein V1659_00770 [Candidatus Woesearchaeota archaeon]